MSQYTNGVNDKDKICALFERRKQIEENNQNSWEDNGLSSLDHKWRNCGNNISLNWPPNHIQSIGERRKPSEMPHYTNSEDRACRLPFGEEKNEKYSSA